MICPMILVDRYGHLAPEMDDVITAALDGDLDPDV
jgi:hypothetical protein